MKIECPRCQQHLEIETADVQTGTSITCPQCSAEFELAIDTEPEPAPPPSPVPPPFKKALIVTTGNEITGRAVDQYLGIVRGVVVRSPTSTQSLFGGLEKILGGNIDAYTQLCEQARTAAFARMTAHATSLKADAVLACRLTGRRFNPPLRYTGLQELDTRPLMVAAKWGRILTKPESRVSVAKFRCCCWLGRK